MSGWNVHAATTDTDYRTQMEKAGDMRRPLFIWVHL
jgi:hypothetical protein